MEFAKDVLSPKQFKTLVGSIQQHFNRDNPPPEQVLVMEDNIKVNEKTRTFYARVQIVTNWCVHKVHTVTIRFKTNNCHMIPKSMGYV
jgi:hypothetical protein